MLFKRVSQVSFGDCMDILNADALIGSPSNLNRKVTGEGVGLLEKEVGMHPA
jgi:hypothetical protein